MQKYRKFPAPQLREQSADARAFRADASSPVNRLRRPMFLDQDEQIDHDARAVVAGHEPAVDVQAIGFPFALASAHRLQLIGPPPRFVARSIDDRSIAGNKDLVEQARTAKKTVEIRIGSAKSNFDDPIEDLCV